MHQQFVIKVLGGLFFVFASCGPLKNPQSDQPQSAFARPLAPGTDITSETGFSVRGRLTNWITVKSNKKTEHLAGISETSDLIHFYWNAANNKWRAENLSSITGQKVKNSVTSWITPDGSNTVEHIASVSSNNDLIVFYRNSGNNIWKTVNVTAKTNARVAGGLSSWQTPNGPYNVEHIAARNSDGRLLVFWWSPAKDWQVVNVSQKTGVNINSDVTNWQIRRGQFLTEYLAATSTANKVVVFAWSPSADWNATATPFTSTDGATPWLTGEVEHLAGVGSDSTLYVLWRKGQGAWNYVDVTDITGEKVMERPAGYQFKVGSENVEFLTARGPGNHALVFWWKPSRDWQAFDITEITGSGISTPPVSWTTNATSDRISEHLAAVGANGRLRVFYSYDQPRVFTDRLGTIYENIPRMRNTNRKILTILWDPHYPDDAGGFIPKPLKTTITTALYGTDGMGNYFRENSGKTFRLQNEGILGWYDAEHPLDYYDGDSNGDGQPYDRDKAGAAIRASDADINYKIFDEDGDGKVEPHELSIVFIHPGRQGGLYRINGRKVKDDRDGSTLFVDGVKIEECVEVGIGHPTPNFSVVAHELCHALFNLPDMYFTFFTPTAAGSYSIMDATYNKAHIDAFHKMKLGWAHPRIVFRSGAYKIPEVETRHRVYVLMDPMRSEKEYFLLANRWKGSSFDRFELPDEGIAVWHVMEDPAVYNAAPPPPTVDATQWATVGGGRSYVRMIRPDLHPPFLNRRSLWDAAEGNLLSTETDLSKPGLRWGNQSASGFNLKNFSAPGQVMEVTIETPW